MILLALLLAALPANSISVGTGATLCSEANKCVINAVTPVANGVLYFGTGTTWCATSVSLAKFPITVSYSQMNPALCASDPAPNIAKSIVAVKGVTAYTVTYTVNGGSPIVFPVPSSAPPPTVLNCTGTMTIPASGGQVLALSCK